VTLINITPIKNHAMRSPAGPPTARADPEPTNKPVPIDPPAQGMTRSGNFYSEKSIPTAIIVRCLDFIFCCNIGASAITFSTSLTLLLPATI